MIEFTFKAENETIKNAFVNFITNYKANAADYMNQLVANDGGPCDAEIKLEDGVLTVYHIAPDKGFVLGETGNDEVPIQVMQYKDLKAEKRYILPERDKLILFFKEQDGVADVRLGAFKTLADAITSFNSDLVKQEVEKFMKARKEKEAAIAKEQKRTENRLERLAKQSVGKQEIEDAQVVE